MAWFISVPPETGALDCFAVPRFCLYKAPAAHGILAAPPGFLPCLSGPEVYFPVAALNVQISANNLSGSMDIA